MVRHLPSDQIKFQDFKASGLVTGFLAQKPLSVFQAWACSQSRWLRRKPECHRLGPALPSCPHLYHLYLVQSSSNFVHTFSVDPVKTINQRWTNHFRPFSYWLPSCLSSGTVLSLDFTKEVAFRSRKYSVWPFSITFGKYLPSPLWTQNNYHFW